MHLVKSDKEASAEERQYYQSLIGSLLYANLGTRPDISFAVGRLAQYAANPSPKHLSLAKYVLKYLKGTINYRIRYDGANGVGLYGYSDSSWGDNPDDYRSTSGYVFLLAEGAISWSSRKQKTIALSTTEAEYMALTDAGNQATWYQSFYSELGYNVEDPILLHGDNKGSVDLASNPVTGRRSKHIQLKHHKIREYVQNNVVDLVRTKTEDMVADGLTKSLAKSRHSLLSGQMGLVG